MLSADELLSIKTAATPRIPSRSFALQRRGKMPMTFSFFSFLLLFVCVSVRYSCGALYSYVEVLIGWSKKHITVCATRTTNYSQPEQGPAQTQYTARWRCENDALSIKKETKTHLRNNYRERRPGFESDASCQSEPLVTTLSNSKRFNHKSPSGRRPSALHFRFLQTVRTVVANTK